MNTGSHMPRIDPADHAVVDEHVLQEARDIAQVHEEYMTEWDINLAEKWCVQPVDRKKPSWTRQGQYGEPLHSDSDSDGSQDLSCSSNKAWHYSRPAEQSERNKTSSTPQALADDEDYVRDFLSATRFVYVCDDQGCLRTTH